MDQAGKTGDDAAFTALYRHHYSFLYRYLMKLTLQQELTEEIMQETMLKAYMKLSSLEEIHYFQHGLCPLHLDNFRSSKEKKT